MKNELLAILSTALTMAVLLGGLAAFSGCAPEDNTNHKQGIEHTYYTDTIDGHEFIIHNDTQRFGITLHPDCPKCEAKRAEIKENRPQSSFLDLDFE